MEVSVKKKKVPKQKWYAIKSLDKVIINKIVTSWDECNAIVKYHTAVYKSFTNEEEAKLFLLGMTEFEAQQKEDRVRIAMETSIEKRKLARAQQAKSNTYHVTVDKKLAEKFEEKLTRMHQNANEVLIDFVREYIGEIE